MRPQNNVLSERFGRGAVDGLGPELDRFVAVTMPIPWALVESRLGAGPRHVTYVASMEFETVERQLCELPEFDTVLAVGGGQAIDLGKYFAWRTGRRLASVPTILSVDAFVTPTAAIRRAHRVEYVGQASPDPLVIDYDLIRRAPRQLNIAGLGDILSIHTATRDWELAAAAGRDEHAFSEDQVRRARQVLAETLDRIDEIRNASDAGLQAIVDAYLRINEICLPAGHYRAEEGSEHYLFYELEERLQRAFVHGQIVGLGVYLMSRLQENAPEWISAALDELGLAYHPAELEVSRPQLVASLRNLRSFAAQRGLWHTVIDEREIDDAWLVDSLQRLRF